MGISVIYLLAKTSHLLLQMTLRISHIYPAECSNRAIELHLVIDPTDPLDWDFALICG